MVEQRNSRAKFFDRYVGAIASLFKKYLRGTIPFSDSHKGRYTDRIDHF